MLSTACFECLGYRSLSFPHLRSSLYIRQLNEEGPSEFQLLDCGLVQHASPKGLRYRKRRKQLRLLDVGDCHRWIIQRDLLPLHLV